jgi:hypothetical protein
MSIEPRSATAMRWVVRHLPARLVVAVLVYAFAKATTGPWSHLSSSDVQFSTVYGRWKDAQPEHDSSLPRGRKVPR